MLETNKKFAPGSEAWLAGEKDTFTLVDVTARQKNTIKIKPKDGGKSMKMDIKRDANKIFPANSSVVSDMTSLQFFHVPGILHNLKERSLADEPYTFLSGSVLVAVNPLQRVPDPKGLLGSTNAVNTPHPYAIAESAFQQLVFNSRRKDNGEAPVDQSVIVGGESGAGKTESSKYVLKHLVSRSSGGGKDDDLDRRLIESNPILEAFGNAATKRNHNSSRFGKFMKLHFKSKKKSKDPPVIFGASVNTYLLERSRVTFHVEGERTYHIFYQLVAGADKKLRKKLKIGDEKFDFMKPKKAPTGHGAPAKASKKNNHSSHLPTESDDKSNFKELCKALKTVGVSISDDDDASDKNGGLFEAVAAILHLGNIEFVDKDSSEGDVASVKNESALDAAAKLLDVKSSKLAKVFTEHTVKTVREEVTKKRDAKGAKYALDAVVKYLYVGIFDWLVDRITISLSEKGSLEDLPFIGVLDIFGFETFKINDFEQLLINFTNEALQSCFNQQIFQAEAQLYEREGLLVDAKDRQMPPDNLECVALLQGGSSSKKSKSSSKNKEKDNPGYAQGVLGVIDAEGKNPQAHDDKLNAALHRTFKKNEYFPSPHPKDIRSCFIIKHYAGDVKYTVGSFIEKNRDDLPNEVGKVLKASKVGVVKSIFSGKKGDSDDDSGGGKKKKKSQSVSGKFKAQMTSLIDDLNTTRCAFIRCIKPNASMTRKKDDSWFDPTYVMPQLVNLSIPQTAEVLRGGLPTRVEFQLFIESYSELLPKDAIRAWKKLGGSDDKLFVKALFYAFEIGTDTYKLGLTRVFFKSGMLEKVNEVLASSMSGKKLDKEIVRRFKRAFARALWRRAFAKAVACGVFLKILEESRERERAAKILQELAKRKMLEAQAKEEARERRKAKEKEEALKAEKAAKAAKKAAKEAKKREKEASEEEKEKLALESLLAEEHAEKESRRAKTLSMRVINNKKIDQESRKSVGHLISGDLKDIEQQKQIFRKSVARDYRMDDDEEEEEEPIIIEQGAFFKVTGRKKNSRRRRGTSASDPGGGLDPFRRSSVISNITCFSRLFKRRPSAELTQRVQSSRSGGRRESGSVIDDSPVAQKQDDWRECVLIIRGYQIRYYEGLILEDPENIKKPPTGTVQIDDQMATRVFEDPEGDDPTPIIAIRKQVSLHAVTEPLQFRITDNFDRNRFLEEIERAKTRYESELAESLKFENSALSPEMLEYQNLFEKGLISKTELEMALAQQLMTEADYLDEFVGNFGADAYADYKIQCNECYEFIFNLPAEPLEVCPYCEEGLLDPPHKIEQDAREARMKVERSRELAFSSTNRKDQTNFDFFVKLGKEKFIFQRPELKSSHDGTRQVFLFQMEWHRQEEGDDDWDSFLMSETWGSMRDFFTQGIHEIEEIDRDALKQIPDWPKAPDGSTGEDKAEKQLSLVCRFFIDFLNVVESKKLMKSDIIRAFLGYVR